jgi:presenilin-like A22 family membrane protease
VSPLTLYGATAVSVMLVSYALERRSAWWVLVFALACGASSLYGFLAGTWPFGIVEGIWALVAARRWFRRHHESAV